MARSFSMTWIPGRKGWMKEENGKKYAVRCRQLGRPETKEGSYQAANDWWQAKRAEIDGYTAQPVKPAAGNPEAIDALLEAWVGRAVETPLDAAAAVRDIISS